MEEHLISDLSKSRDKLLVFYWQLSFSYTLYLSSSLAILPPLSLSRDLSNKWGNTRRQKIPSVIYYLVENSLIFHSHFQKYDELLVSKLAGWREGWKMQDENKKRGGAVTFLGSNLPLFTHSLSLSLHPIEIQHTWRLTGLPLFTAFVEYVSNYFLVAFPYTRVHYSPTVVPLLPPLTSWYHGLHGRVSCSCVN